MSKEKQIEEMAWDLCDIPKHPNIKSCEQCGNKSCHAMYYAKRAYEAGYRKQIYAENLARHKSREFECSLCHWEDWDLFVADSDYKYCPNCGAKIRGE